MEIKNMRQDEMDDNTIGLATRDKLCAEREGYASRRGVGGACLSCFFGGLFQPMDK